MRKIIYAVLLLGGYAGALVTVPPVGSDLKITIYNDNRAFIQDMRKVTVEKGKQKLVYEGVPASVITQSVVPTFEGMRINLYSQNYMYDLVSLHSMLLNSIGKTVGFYANGEKSHLEKGLLLSVDPVMIQEEKSGTIVTLERATQVVFSRVPDSMITKPSLVWNLETEKAGTLGIDLKYLASGISWKSDYVLNLRRETLDLTGWITVKNNSGVSYVDAQITCLAGDVHRAEEPKTLSQVMYKRGINMDMAMPESVSEASFSGYHIYRIPFRETIANKQQKQISFIDKRGVSYIQYGLCQNSYFERYKEQKLHFANTIRFENTQENHLGIALPRGVVRMYQNDEKNETHFIGEQRVGNIPEDENVTLTVGTLFDAVGEKRITKYVARRHYRNVETSYWVRNQGKTALLLKIKEMIPVYGEHITLKTSCKGNCSVEKKSAFVREFSIKLKAKEAYSFTSEFEVYGN